MKPKYKPCINCGANECEITSLNTVKCEYCGTEYEIELPKREEPEIYHSKRFPMFSTVGITLDTIGTRVNHPVIFNRTN